MKKLFLVFVGVIIICSYTFAQNNLVINGDFETKTACPISGFEINKVPPWETPNLGTPDFFDSCGNTIVSVPNNSIGFQKAHSGSGYLGIGVYFVTSISSNYREYLQGTLSKKLIPAHKYLLEFYISLADIPYQNSSIVAINKIGAFITQNSFYSGTISSLQFVPQIISDTTIFYSDTTNWMKVKGIYKANGNEKYITLGNFSNDSLTGYQPIVNSNILPISILLSYYYIDDVSLYEITEPHAIADTTICLGDSLIIGANDTAIACNWYPAEGINETSLTNPKASPKQSTWYYVSHYNSFGYLAKDSVHITVINCSNESSLILPNIISPNNDGVNDFFTAKSTNLASFNCQLINRWGVLVAELSEPNQSWNGTTKSGVALPEGVYYYVVSAKGKDDKEYNLKGFVSLVR
ncbi:MAG: gliding motility-associated C-terminal domain-containing protein [Bacteroidetes bacterium]|nr:gliding motility-associated C-terminal domain-containing protein [Bacteroidota bacterium]